MKYTMTQAESEACRASPWGASIYQDIIERFAGNQISVIELECQSEGLRMGVKGYLLIDDEVLV